MKALFFIQHSNDQKIITQIEGVGFCLERQSLSESDKTTYDSFMGLLSGLKASSLQVDGYLNDSEDLHIDIDVFSDQISPNGQHSIVDYNALEDAQKQVSQQFYELLTTYKNSLT